MELNSVTDEQYRGILQILSGIKDLKFAYLFGSYAQNNSKLHSDLDLGIYTENKLSWEIISELESALTFSTKINDIDIVQMKFADVIINNQIVVTGRRIINNDHEAWLRFRSTLFSMYIDFKRTRKVIEDNLFKPVL